MVTHRVIAVEMVRSGWVIDITKGMARKVEYKL